MEVFLNFAPYPFNTKKNLSVLNAFRLQNGFSFVSLSLTFPFS